MALPILDNVNISYESLVSPKLKGIIIAHESLVSPKLKGIIIAHESLLAPKLSKVKIIVASNDTITSRIKKYINTNNNSIVIN